MQWGGHVARIIGWGSKEWGCPAQGAMVNRTGAGDYEIARGAQVIRRPLETKDTVSSGSLTCDQWPSLTACREGDTRVRWVRWGCWRRFCSMRGSGVIFTATSYASWRWAKFRIWTHSHYMRPFGVAANWYAHPFTAPLPRLPSRAPCSHVVTSHCSCSVRRGVWLSSLLLYVPVSFSFHT